LGTFVQLTILDVCCDSEWLGGLPMTKSLTICALVLGIGCSISGSAFPQDLRPGHQAQNEQYVPTSGGIINFLFGGPRYYDRQMFTMAAGACSYHPVGPDADAANKINDHYCGK
jgi:hypothetical protein